MQSSTICVSAPPKSSDSGRLSASYTGAVSSVAAAETVWAVSLPVLSGFCASVPDAQAESGLPAKRLPAARRETAANRESVADLISGLLAESVKNWCDYCDSLRLLEMEDERVCVVDKPE